ncbi:MAG: DUF1800 family protein [Phycisphaerales bacterium]
MTANQPARDLLDPIPNDQFGYEQARHLLWRAGFGGSDEQIRTLVELGPRAAVDLLVDYEDIPTESDPIDAFDKDIMQPLAADELRTRRMATQRQDEDTLAGFRAKRQAAQRADRGQMRQLQRWWITRMIQTARPLEEKLTLFWHGHFATSYRSVEDSYHLYQQNRMFRGSAMSYPQLLRGIIRDPAMLKYLNNNRNRKSSPNENLAREIMELFSLGEGNYSEQDIKEGARALTGYTYQDDAFVFRQAQHDTGPKQILGTRGSINGDGFVNAILRHRACAPYMANRLYRFFVADVAGQPDELVGVHKAAVRKLADRMRRSDYELKPVLKTMFLSRHFYSDAVMGQKIKSPTELLVGAIRSLGVPSREVNLLIAGLERMGQQLFYPPSVKGWDGGRAWINTATMFVRQNMMMYLITGQRETDRTQRGRANNTFDPRRALPMLIDPDRPADDREVAGKLLELAFGKRDPQTIEVLAEAAKSNGGVEADKVLPGLLILITSMPEYQLC